MIESKEDMVNLLGRISNFLAEIKEIENYEFTANELIIEVDSAINATYDLLNRLGELESNEKILVNENNELTHAVGILKEESDTLDTIVSGLRELVDNRET